MLDAMSDTASTTISLEHAEPEWTLGERIRKCRKIMGLDQVQFGALFDVSDSLVSKWENDVREPKLSELRKMEDVCPVPRGFLIRSRWSRLSPLRLLPGGQSGPSKMSQTALPLFASAVDN